MHTLYPSSTLVTSASTSLKTYTHTHTHTHSHSLYLSPSLSLSLSLSLILFKHLLLRGLRAKAVVEFKRLFAAFALVEHRDAIILQVRPLMLIYIYIILGVICVCVCVCVCIQMQLPSRSGRSCFFEYGVITEVLKSEGPAHALSQVCVPITYYTKIVLCELGTLWGHYGVITEVLKSEGPAHALSKVCVPITYYTKIVSP